MPDSISRGNVAGVAVNPKGTTKLKEAILGYTSGLVSVVE